VFKEKVHEGPIIKGKIGVLLPWNLWAEIGRGVKGYHHHPERCREPDAAPDQRFG
jgi:hypothetical protein